MKEFKGTKGNWSVGKTLGCVVSTDTTGFERATGHLDIDYYGGSLIAESIYKHSDAKLISAAPDLLEGCIAAIAVLKSVGVDENHLIVGDQYKIIQSAINKALGNV